MKIDGEIESRHFGQILPLLLQGAPLGSLMGTEREVPLLGTAPRVVAPPLVQQFVHHAELRGPPSSPSPNPIASYLI
jgi:hypothetical protein